MSKTTVFSTQHILERANLEIHFEVYDREVGAGSDFTMGQRILQHAWDHIRGIATCEDSAVIEFHDIIVLHKHELTRNLLDALCILQRKWNYCIANLEFSGAQILQHAMNSVIWELRNFHIGL